ncbi:MAG: hypothetical protein KDA96_10740 [Planctomycetaceae bacterium]|nr:hypothetical protein [Planctomycetaceae bacterium]
MPPELATVLTNASVDHGNWIDHGKVAHAETTVTADSQGLAYAAIDPSRIDEALEEQEVYPEPSQDVYLLPEVCVCWETAWQIVSYIYLAGERCLEVAWEEVDSLEERRGESWMYQPGDPNEVDNSPEIDFKLLDELARRTRKSREAE